MRVKFWRIEIKAFAVGRVQHENGRGVAAGVYNFFGGVAEKVAELRRNCGRGFVWRDLCERATFDVVLDDAYRAFGNIARDDFGDCRECVARLYWVLHFVQGDERRCVAFHFVQGDASRYKIPGGFFEGGLVLECKIAARAGNDFICDTGGFEAERAAAGH